MQRMDRIRRSLRDSFRRKREAPESSKPHQWQADEEAVRAGTCSFHVKYLGCVEVFESRGMQVCEEAMKVLRQSRRRPVKSTLFVSGDGLRVVEDDTKGLIVDQTIEKVSFCAPDRNHERGFSYICRDGTTRRWMCHGFLASKESGERLSHAVGCAFAACLERKQKREKECGVSMTYDPKTSTFTRSGSFRVPSMTESGGNNPTSPPLGVDLAGQAVKSASSITTAAIERPHAPAKMLERQGSFRGFSQLANRSPFKRQLSLRLNELPSNLQRTQPQPNNVDILTNNNIVIPPPDPMAPVSANASPTPPPRTQRNRLHSLPNNSLSGVGLLPATNSTVSSISPAVSSVLSKFEQNKDLVTELCQQVTQGLSLLAANHDEPKEARTTSGFPTKFTNPWDEEVEGSFPPKPSGFDDNVASAPRVPPIQDDWTKNIAHNLAGNQAPKPVMEKVTSVSPANNLFSKVAPVASNVSKTEPGLVETRRPPAKLPPHLEQDPIKEAAALWNSTPPAVGASVPRTANGSKDLPPLPPPATAQGGTASRPPLVSSGSVAGPMPGQIRPGAFRGASSRSHSLGADPFDADWASNVARTGQTPTNPFARQQTFQISM